MKNFNKKMSVRAKDLVESCSGLFYNEYTEDNDFGDNEVMDLPFGMGDAEHMQDFMLNASF